MDEIVDREATELAGRLVAMIRDGDEGLLRHVDDGVPVELSDGDGNTLLMLAVHHGHAGLVQGLAARGADVDTCNHAGQSPLASAVYKNNAEVVRALLAEEANPDRGTPTARQTAEMFRRLDMTALLPPPRLT